MAVMYIFSSFHVVPLPQIDRLSTDKIYHTVEYTILGYLFMRAFVLSDFKLPCGLTVIMVYLFGTLFGITDEIHQIFVPGRFYSYWDMAADSFGILIGLLIYLKWGAKVDKRILSIIKYFKRK
jgi:VanZ family protein